MKTPPVVIAPGEPLIKVDVGLSAGAVVDKEFLGAGGPGETPDSTAGQAQLPGGLRQVPALGQQAVHLSVPGPASDPPGSRQLQGCRLAGRRGQRPWAWTAAGSCSRCRHRPLDRLGEVVPQVPAVRDLDRVRRTAGAAV